ncbi:HNH endonuclease signature motif containing protein [Microbacterium sp. T2.11-28]|uniref:HNH endonuclease n=1 Tax=Microbacterium sp. T2.11-28 TaxID=3041169 RepID=UPI002477A760|nr:HNH endonuclease signature motif containing protein [Microbacterium sp. T2.11-28]CAI9389787.1 putative protein [Microbacterium sp. T2.11-28]
MTTPLHRIAEALDALASAGGERAPEALSPGELIAVTAAFGALRRHVEAAFAPVAAEVARQSRAELGRDSLARRQGFRTPVAMIATATASTGGEAARLLQVGEATAPRRSLTGELLPAAHPHVAAAFAAGAVGTWAASQIVGLLDRLAFRVNAARRDDAERQLVDLAPGLRPDELTRVIARAEAHLDPDGVEPREHERRDDRSLMIQERDGMTLLTARLDPETAAPVRAAIDGIVTGALRRNEHREEAERDQRSVKQLQADALADLCRHALGCDALPAAPSATVVVRVALDALISGEGVATIDGIDTPVSARTARRIAADAELIPCVLGGESEILDWGRAKRLFTRSQKLALGERDGGCASCGAPAAWTHVHHIRWWERDRGTTDLANGVLLCSGCHHRIHDDGWEVEVDGTGTTATVWLIPPPWIDPTRAPRRGGRARYELTA